MTTFCGLQNCLIDSSPLLIINNEIISSHIPLEGKLAGKVFIKIFIYKFTYKDKGLIVLIIFKYYTKLDIVAKKIIKNYIHI